MSVALCPNPVELKVKHSLNNVSEALVKLENRIGKSELAIYDFKKNNIHLKSQFDLFSEELQLGIRVKAYSCFFEETENQAQIELNNSSCLGVRELVVSDYQVIIDADEVIRYLKCQLFLKTKRQMNA
ncbi:hypothetical protein [Aquimarina agarilytica]|uniref:hypothetical protein n=1 Tax=Aquimarina agarilytica TaxID=1087449 RepID=UPI0002882470|nr:hypothetical protein [Aquimarina agarilytica]